MLMENFLSTSGSESAARRVATEIAKFGKIHLPSFTFAHGEVTDHFASNRPGGKSHEGIDYKVPFGSSVIAPTSGTIKRRYYDNPYGGFSVVFKPDNYSFEFRIRHFSQFSPARTNEVLEKFKKGKLDENLSIYVDKGHVLGYSGLSGRASAKPGFSIVHIATYFIGGSKFDPETVLSLV